MDKYEDFSVGEIITLISGITPSLEETLQYERQGFMMFTGNQWNEDWDWNRNKLEHYPKWWLVNFYEELKKKKEYE